MHIRLVRIEWQNRLEELNDFLVVLLIVDHATAVLAIGVLELVLRVI